LSLKENFDNGKEIFFILDEEKEIGASLSQELFD
jgi:hypothetical protein